MAVKKASSPRKNACEPVTVTDSTEYVTNHPRKINWKKVKSTVRTFAKSNKATLKKACQG